MAVLRMKMIWKKEKKINCYINTTESVSGIINCRDRSCFKTDIANREIYIKGKGIELIRCEDGKC